MSSPSTQCSPVGLQQGHQELELRFCRCRYGPRCTAHDRTGTEGETFWIPFV